MSPTLQNPPFISYSWILMNILLLGFTSSHLVHFLFPTRGVDTTSSDVMVAEMWHTRFRMAVLSTCEIFFLQSLRRSWFTYLLCKPFQFWIKYITRPIRRNITPFFHEHVPEWYFFKQYLISDSEGLQIYFYFPRNSGNNLENKVLNFLENINTASDFLEVLLGFDFCLYKHRKCCNMSSSVRTPLAFSNAPLRVPMKRSACLLDPGW